METTVRKKNTRKILHEKIAQFYFVFIHDLLKNNG